jgi:glyoxylate/hydroxypyruvate reductase
MATVLFYSDIDPVEQWQSALSELAPGLDIRVYPDIGDPSDIDYALVWKPPAGLLASLPNLKLIHSIGAGVDWLFEDATLPTNVPIVRMVDTCMKNMMAEYAIYAVLHFHRDMPRYQAQQAVGYWSRHWPAMTTDSPVAILGLGEIGAGIARKFAALDFPTLGWSRSEKDIPGVTCHHGPSGLDDILAASCYVVCALPLTDETSNIIDASFLGRMRQGSYLINIGRGAHVVDDDLLAALDSGHLAGAFIDVFHNEPLPVEHPFWRHPKVIITPHVAAETDPAAGAREVIRNFERFESGDELPTLVALTKGY